VKPTLLRTLSLLPLLAGCGGGEANEAANSVNVAAEEGIDPNMMIGGDELSPIPEAEDDMIANNSAAASPAPQLR